MARYHAVVAGKHSMDLLVEGVLLIEQKTAMASDDVHRIERTDYLNATGLPLCLLLNFGRSCLEIECVARGL
jgi:GxxExxY protein